MTTNQITQLLKTDDSLEFDYEIIDEASKCSFEDIIISLPRVKNLILIGDYMQLNKLYDQYDDFKKAAPPFSQDAFYYLIEENLLFKYRGLDEKGQHKWQQINSVSDVQASVKDLEEALDGVKNSVTGLQTAVNDITKTGGTIDVAKQAAIDAAAADATTKANNAKDAAIADATGKINTLTATVNGKVDTTTFNTTVEGLEGDIADAITTAAGDATTKANAAESAAKSHADSEIAKAKTALEGQINGKVS
jgi:hypothetical protein